MQFSNSVFTAKSAAIFREMWANGSTHDAIRRACGLTLSDANLQNAAKRFGVHRPTGFNSVAAYRANQRREARLGASA